MTFEEWWEEWGREDPGIREKVSRGWAEFIWTASRANMVESESERLQNFVGLARQVINCGTEDALQYGVLVESPKPSVNSDLR